MLEVAQQLVEADRAGSWEMHLHAVPKCLPIFAAAIHGNYLKSAYLYLQKMAELKFKHPAGMGSNLVIEQTLMQSLKSTGRLTRGSDMTEHQRGLWTMSVPISSAYNFAMQDFSNTLHLSSEQHKKATLSQVEMDRTDLQRLASKLEQHSPFTEEQAITNDITGLNAGILFEKNTIDD